MTLWGLITKEIQHNLLLFVLGLIAIVVGVGVFVGQVTLLNAHDLETERLLEARQQRIEEKMQAMQEEYRQIMDEHGFNLLILPKDQQLDNFYDEGFVSQFMPEAYVEQLAASGSLTITHLLPVLEQKIRWPEQFNRTIVLAGIRNEVMSQQEGNTVELETREASLVEAVRLGSMHIGYELWNSMRLNVGDTVTLLGERLKIAECLPQQGSQEDISVWLDLRQAQKLLGKEQQINMIKALKTYTSTRDFTTIRTEITDILPQTQVVILENDVTTLAQTRDRAKEAEAQALQAEQDHRDTLRSQLQTFTMWFVPIVLIISLGLVVLLAFTDVNKRRPEIGVLRALGFKSQQIFQVFLTKAFLLGICGAIIGIGIALLVTRSVVGEHARQILFNMPLLLTVLLGTPLLILGASWIPASLAAGQDPAVVLREE
jgi:ABC-type lipoprotein release transport system permease subunit